MVCHSLNRLAIFPMFPEHAARLSCYETRKVNQSRCGWVIPTKRIQTISHCFNSETCSSNIDLLPLLQSGVLAKELICSSECRVVMNVQVPFEQIPNGKPEFRQPGLPPPPFFSPRSSVCFKRWPTLVNTKQERYTARGDHLLPYGLPLRQPIRRFVERAGNHYTHGLISRPIRASIRLPRQVEERLLTTFHCRKSIIRYERIFREVWSGWQRRDQ